MRVSVHTLSDVRNVFNAFYELWVVGLPHTLILFTQAHAHIPASGIFI